MITFKEAFDRITIAYLNNKLRPFDGCACFVGNLLQAKRVLTPIAIGYLNSWEVWREQWKERKCNMRSRYNFDVVTPFENYTWHQIYSLEENFLTTLHNFLGSYPDERYTSHILNGDWLNPVSLSEMPLYEEALFQAMVSTLDMLKQIHIARGEQVDELVLNKRQ